MKVGLFGGTFNPIHLGHLRSAEEVREAFALDRIVFIPSARPPHKSGADLASAAHRLRMVELAVHEHPCFSASGVELERAGTSFSIDTIRFFLTTLQPAQIFFILGYDAFCEIHTWKDYQVIPELCDLIVTSRPGLTMPAPDRFLPVALQAVFWYDPKEQVYRHSSGHILITREIVGLPLSSSAVRETARHSKSVRYLVPQVVADYISDHALYQSAKV